MKVSIFTPTHNPSYLNEVFDSIKKQSYQNWEWVLVPNNGAIIPKEIRNHPKVEVFPLSNEKKVGALKKYACDNCKGDILLELDHDDILTNDCLEKVVSAFNNPEIGFVYSDNAKLGDFEPYSSDFGWSYRKFEWEGKQLFAMFSQPLTPGRLGYIWYAPDHVRAWRKSVYDAVGGHDKKLAVNDDQDLICRTYLNARFYHIPEVLYIYRINGENTWLQRNAEIQKQSHEIYKKYIYSLAMRYAEINGLMAIDLCGGFNKPKGYLSVDKENGDILANLEEGIPIGDNRVGVIRAHDALEHVKNQQLLMKEIYRVLAPGGILLSMTPSTDGRGAWQDPTHVSFWNQNSFWYWTRQAQAKYINNTDCRFRECRLETVFPSQWHRQNDISYVIAHLEKL